MAGRQASTGAYPDITGRQAGSVGCNPTSRESPNGRGVICWQCTRGMYPRGESPDLRRNLISRQETVA